MKKLFTLLTMLIVAISTSWATDIDVVEHAAHAYKTFPVNGGLFTITNTSSMTISSNYLCMKNGTGKFQISTTVPGYTLKEIVFTDKNSGKNGGFTCEDGDYMTGPSSNIYTYTAPASTTAANFQLIGNGGTAQMEITSLVLTTSDNIVELYGFATSPSWSFTSNPTSDIAITTTNSSGFSLNGNLINWSNNSGTSTTTTKDLTITSASNIKYVTFVIKEDKIPANDKMILSGGTGTYANGVWTATEDSKTISFRQNTGSSIYVEKIFVALEAASTNPSISANNVEITNSATTEGEIAFTVANPVTGGAVTTEKKTTADWLTLGTVDNTNGKVPFSATANTGEERSATVTLTYTYTEDETEKTVTKDVTITQAAEIDGTVIIRSDITSSSATDKAATGTVGGTTSYTVQNSVVDGGYKFGSGAYVSLTLANGTFKTGDIINIYITKERDIDGSNIIVYGSSADDVLYNTEVQGIVGENVFVLPEAVNGKSTISIRRTGDNAWNAYVKYVEVTRSGEKVSIINLNSKGYATYSKATDFEYAGADAYGMKLTATSLSGTKVTTGKIKAGEGVLFKGAPNANVMITETTGAEALENNSLIGTTDINNEVISPLSYTYKYALSGDTFKKLNGALVANKAFFGTNEELSNSLDIVFDGATAINNVNANDNANSAAPVKVIKNGQLFIGNYNVAGARIK